MKRGLLNLLTVLSLVLCVAAVAMWVRSHVTADHINYFRWVGSGRDVVERHRMFSAASAEGALIVSTMQVLRLEGGFESGSQTGWRYGRAPSHPDHILRALSLPFFGGPRECGRAGGRLCVSVPARPLYRHGPVVVATRTGVGPPRPAGLSSPPLRPAGFARPLPRLRL